MKMAKDDVSLDDVARLAMENTTTIALLAHMFGALFEITRALLRDLSDEDPTLPTRLAEIAEPILASRDPQTIAAAREYLATISPLKEHFH